MFMFWSKRTLLTRRLLKAKVRGEHETECETQENHNLIPYSNPSEINNPRCGSSASSSSLSSDICVGVGSCDCCCCGSESSTRLSSPRKNRFSRATSTTGAAKSCCVVGCSRASCSGYGVRSYGGGESGAVESKSSAAAAAAAEENVGVREDEVTSGAEDVCVDCCGVNVVSNVSTTLCNEGKKNCANNSQQQRRTAEATRLCARGNLSRSETRCTCACGAQLRYTSATVVDHPSGQHQSGNNQSSRREDNSRHAHGGLVGDDPHHGDQTNARLVRCKEILKSLKETQLETLLASVETYGADLSSCVLLPRRRKSAATMTPTYEDSESIQMTRCNASRHSPHRHHHHHHDDHNHHHHHHHHHNRRQRQCSDSRTQRRDFYPEENLPIDERVVCTATTTTSINAGRLGRGERIRSRTSGNANELPAEPHLLFCQIWRWPDLASSSELKRLPVCHSVDDPVHVCCNPYHWSRLCKPESPPPPYCLIADRLRPEDRAPSEGSGGDEGDETFQGYDRNTNSPPLPGSLTTNGEDVSGQREWCTLAYWELGGRVGRLYPVEPSTVNVFDSLLDGDGLCLATLAENHSSVSPAIERTRSKIGLGLMLSQESDGVWAYNRSENPIFVNSPTLDDPESRTLLVYRVPPGFCLNIFDRVKTLKKRHPRQHHRHHRSHTTSPSPGCLPAPGSGGGLASGPVDVNSVRISFAKGWGPKYSRQEVTSCPCWLEVLLAPCR